MGRRPKFEQGFSRGHNAMLMETNETEQKVLLLAIQLGRFSATQVCEYLGSFKSRPSLERALKSLTDQGYFARFRPLMNAGEGSHPYVYQMTKKGARKGFAYFYNFKPDLKYDYKVPKGRTIQLRHRLEANDAFLRIIAADKKVDERARLGLGLVGSRVANNAVERLKVCEYEYGEPEYMMLRPDALLIHDSRYERLVYHDEVKRYSGMPISMYLEVDRGTEKISQIRRQMDFYIGAYYLSYWANEHYQFPLVAWVFKRHERARELLDLLQRFYSEPRLVSVKTSRHTYREIDVTYDIQNLHMCVTTKSLFDGAESATQENIWYLHDSRGPLSLEKIFEKRGIVAAEIYEEQKRAEEMRQMRRALLNKGIHPDDILGKG